MEINKKTEKRYNINEIMVGGGGNQPFQECKDLAREIKLFFSNKIYLICIGLAAVLSYGFTITHHAIGMDDTVVSMYFQDGLAAYMGRWSLFLISKVFSIADFIPWTTEFMSVLILILSVTLWCVLWKKTCEPKVQLPLGAYGLVGGIFISSPIISEVFVFFLHNGICTGYGMVALALLALRAGFQKWLPVRKRFGYLGLSGLFLLIAIGFYESFSLVYILGAVILFALIRGLYGKQQENACYENRLGIWFLTGAALLTVVMVLRAMITKILELTFHLEVFEPYHMRYYHLFGNLLSDRSELNMVLKRFYVKYYVNAIVYLPISVLVAVLLFLGAVSLYFGIRKKDFCLPLCFIALIILPVFMSIVEGLTTRYRSAQYVPMLCSFGIFVLLLLLYAGGPKPTRNILCFILLGILTFNQCADSNKWFYLDWLKYQNAKEVMLRIAYDVQKNCDTSKAIVFCGAYPVPYSISSDAYVSYSSTEYKWISALTDPIDVHLKEKYHNGPGGYVFAESPIISVLAWGITAFDGTSWQLIRFLELHGIEGLHCEKDLNKIAEARKIMEEEKMPGYPAKGYMKECDDYIIINMTQ